MVAIDKTPSRLRKYPKIPCSTSQITIFSATTFLARLLGLSLLQSLPANIGLLLPNTRSIHTFGMRFALDLFWLSPDGEIIKIDRNVTPGSLRNCRRAKHVIEFHHDLQLAQQTEEFRVYIR